MGARGPKPGFKKARQEAQQVQPEQSAAPASDVTTDPALVATLPAAYRENPEKLGGEALRQLAHRRGMSRSECARLPDAKVREQLRYVTYRQYDR